MSSKLNDRFDLVIVGGGISSLWLAWHLKVSGLRVAVVAQDFYGATSWHIPGFVCSGWQDNLTRLAHQYSEGFALDFWESSLEGFRKVNEFCRNHQIQVQIGHRLRLAADHLEEKELEKACLLGSRLCSTSFALEKIPYSPFMAQKEEAASALISMVELREILLKDQFVLNARYLSYEKVDGTFQVFTTRGVLSSNALVFCAHHAMAKMKLLPDASWVAYQDQWSELKCEKDIDLPIASYLSIRHHLDWAVLLNRRRLIVGGSRYLRKFAGLGFDQAEFKTDIETHQLKLWQSILDCRLSAVGKRQALVGLRVCDELPVIGAVSFDPQVFVMGGFAGYGLCWGFWAASQLAKLIVGESCSPMLRKLLPTRLRSL